MTSSCLKCSAALMCPGQYKVAIPKAIKADSALACNCHYKLNLTHGTKVFHCNGVYSRVWYIKHCICSLISIKVGPDNSFSAAESIDRWPMDSPHNLPVTRKMFPFNDVIMRHGCIELHQTTIHAYRVHNSWDALVARFSGFILCVARPK